MSSTDRQVDLVKEGFDCVLRLGPIGDETLIARPLGLLRMVNAGSPAYLARYGVPRSVSGTSDNPFFDDAGRKTLSAERRGRRHTSEGDAGDPDDAVPSRRYARRHLHYPLTIRGTEW